MGYNTLCKLVKVDLIINNKRLVAAFRIPTTPLSSNLWMSWLIGVETIRLTVTRFPTTVHTIKVVIITVNKAGT